jgi:hypothetical protein
LTSQPRAMVTGTGVRRGNRTPSRSPSKSTWTAQAGCRRAGYPMTSVESSTSCTRSATSRLVLARTLSSMALDDPLAEHHHMGVQWRRPGVSDCAVTTGDDRAPYGQAWLQGNARSASSR